MALSRVSKNSRVPKNKYNHARFTPMAELRCNYETLLSWLKLVVSKVDSGETHKNGVQDSPKPELPTQLYKMPSDFIDEMLNNLVISDRTLCFIRIFLS